MVLSKCLNNVMSECPWCGQMTRYTHVNGHVQCDACHRPVQDCCSGERADNGLSARAADVDRAREPA